MKVGQRTNAMALNECRSCCQDAHKSHADETYGVDEPAVAVPAAAARMAELEATLSRVGTVLATRPLLSAAIGFGLRVWRSTSANDRVQARNSRSLADVRRGIIRSALCFLLCSQIAQADHWVSETTSQEGTDDALCLTLLKRLNLSIEACATDAIETYPGFTEPPWQDLDPKKHEDLIAKLLKYWQVGPREYFDASSPHSAAEEAAYRRKAKTFIADGGRLRLWRTRLVPTFGNQPVAPGLQSVVLLISHLAPAKDPNECHGSWSHGWIPSLFLVTPDLSSPDPAVDAGNAALLEGRTVLLYKNTPYLVDSDSVFRAFGDAGLHRVCGFKRLTKPADAHKEDRK